MADGGPMDARCVQSLLFFHRAPIGLHRASSVIHRAPSAIHRASIGHPSGVHRPSIGHPSGIEIISNANITFVNKTNNNSLVHFFNEQLQIK
jgi:hypothetical protein